ncbi:MAG: aminoglycoside phosphotransferase family protein [Nitrospinota bacterium]
MKLRERSTIDFDIKTLAGDASDRTYYRLSFHDKNAFPKSVILMKLAEPFNESESDIIRLQRFLSGCGVPVPEIYLTKPERGFIYLEDCGDNLLADHVSGADNNQMMTLYMKVIDLLMVIQIECTMKMEPDNPAGLRKFDTDKYMSELRHTVRYFIKGCRAKQLGPGDEERLEKFFMRLVSPIIEEPMLFTHRDYHARNILIKGGHLYILDYQDGRMGPRHYDLASLLYDSYVKLDGDTRNELINYYMDRWKLAAKSEFDTKAFNDMLKRVSLQRSLKALGTFGYQAMEKQNRFYLRFVPDTLGYIKENLAALKSAAEDSDWIFSLLNE